MSEPLSNVDQVIDKIEQLQVQLEQQLPGYKDLLRTIHTNLKADPDMVHLLTEEQIGVIVAGLQKHTGVVISTAASKGKGTKKASAISADDI